MGKKTGPLEGVMSNAGDAGLSQAEIRAVGRLVDRALAPRAIPDYTTEERFVLAVLVAHLSRQQQLRGKKSTSAAKRNAAFRRDRVNLLLRFVLEKKYRKDQKAATSNRTIMKLIEWLDDTGIVATDSQVRRDVHQALKRGPLMG
ncbi:hypothetical protein [Bradyrhizobium genosp. P]|uniref:hypothetical protein n=1 Tax=Bradyrhizobium genosp. P TaxID=83641 RepID=UPI003CF5E785